MSLLYLSQSKEGSRNISLIALENSSLLKKLGGRELSEKIFVIKEGTKNFLNERPLESNDLKKVFRS